MAKQVIIENPILNSPFEKPKRHFRFTDEGITNEIVEGRRKSAYFIPVPRSKKKIAEMPLFKTEWTEDRVEENKFINQVRDRVALWRAKGRPYTSRVTAQLLTYWTRPDREKRIFFCQIEALETIIYITEAAAKLGDRWIENTLHEENDKSNPLLYRIAFKMATGSGKTVVMSMLIPWHALNKFANPQDARFSDTFLLVTPGITIRDRLRVLLPNDPDNYYRVHDILPADYVTRVMQSKDRHHQLPSDEATRADFCRETNQADLDQEQPLHRNS